MRSKFSYDPLLLSANESLVPKLRADSVCQSDFINPAVFRIEAKRKRLARNLLGPEACASFLQFVISFLLLNPIEKEFVYRWPRCQDVSKSPAADCCCNLFGPLSALLTE